MDYITDIIDYGTGLYRKKFDVLSRKFPNDHGQFTPWDFEGHGDEIIDQYQSRFETIIISGAKASWEYIKSLLNSGNTHKQEEGNKMAKLWVKNMKRKGRSYGKRRSFRKSSNNPKKFKRMLAKYISPEAKRASTMLEATIKPSYVQSQSVIHTFPTPTQGVVQTQRIGREIQVYGYTVKGLVAQNALESTSYKATYTKGRIMIIFDKNPNGQSIPTVPDILDQITGSNPPITTKYNDTNALIKDTARNRFKIIKEVLFELDGVPSTGYNFDFYLKKKHLQQFSSTTSGESYDQFATNGLLFLMTFDCLESDTYTSSIKVRAQLYTHYIDA